MLVKMDINNRSHCTGELDLVRKISNVWNVWAKWNRGLVLPGENTSPKRKENLAKFNTKAIIYLKVRKTAQTWTRERNIFASNKIYSQFKNSPSRALTFKTLGKDTVVKI